MNWIDRLVEQVAPERALQRQLARSQLAQLASLDARRSQHEIRRAGYEGAKIGGRISWTAGGGSANAEIGTARTRLMARSRDLVRNNPYAPRAIHSLVGNPSRTVFILKLPKAAQPPLNNRGGYPDAE